MNVCKVGAFVKRLAHAEQQFSHGAANVSRLVNTRARERARADRRRAGRFRLRLRPVAASRRRHARLPAGAGRRRQGAADVDSRRVRVRRADDRLEGSRSARARGGHSREEALRRRLTGEGGTDAVRHRSEAAGSANRRRAGRPRARAGAEGVERSRSGAAETARRTARDRAEGSRRRGVAGRARGGAGEGRAGKARRDTALPRLHARRSRRCPGSRAGR